jgi:sialic acid synthase SpsE
MALKRLSDEVEPIIIGEKKIGPGEPCFIIAEAGVNHNGSIEVAIELIKAAVEAGADVIKFQTFKAEQVTTKTSPTAAYQKKNVGEDNQWKLLRPLELKEQHYPRLIEECKKYGIVFMSTPHGHIESAKLLESMVPAWKIGSGDLVNLPFLEFLGNTGKPIILSTGMATIEEIKEAVEIIEQTGNKNLIILQCTTNYPCPPEEANVAAMLDIQKNFPDYPIGFSDHTINIDAPILAAALGATVIEKHFTLDRDMPGPDQKNSAEPEELKKMVAEIHRIQSLGLKEKEEIVSQIPEVETLMGTGVKKPFKSEIVIAEMARKAVISAKDIPTGTKITTEMLTIKRPAKGGIHPREYKNIIGKTAKKDIGVDKQLKKGDF